MIELSCGLLASMAMRCRHDFGLMEEYQQRQMQEKMRHIYELFAQGMTDQAVCEQTRYDKITVAQLREEASGNGFFQAV